MATMYLMSLEDRVDLARDQIERVMHALLRSVGMERQDLEQAVNRAAAQLQSVTELIGR